MLVKRAVKALAETRSEFGSSVLPRNSDMIGISPDGQVYNERGALAISSVMNCVKVLHNDIGVLPFLAYTGDKQKVRAPIPNQPLIVTEPFGPDLTLQAGMGQIVASLALRANAFMLVTDRDGLGFPTQLRILHPDTVDVTRDKDSGVKLYRVDRKPVPAADIKHLTSLMLPGGIVGIDPVSYQRITWNLAASVNMYGANFFTNGGTPSVVLEFPQPGDREDARRDLAIWNAGHTGVFNAHKPALMYGGGKITPLSVTPDNAQFLGTRAFLREEICGWFGVPLQRIMAIVDNASQGGGKGLDAMDAGYVKHTLLPLASTIENCWNSMLPGDQRTWTRFDFDEFLRADALERAKVWQIMRVIGVMNQDEVRGEEGKPPIPDGKGTDYQAPLNSNASPTGGADNTPSPDTIPQEQQSREPITVNVDARTSVEPQDISVDARSSLGVSEEVVAQMQVLREDIAASLSRPRRIRKRVERDGRGEITGVVEEEIPA